jgi:hypothetical protein
MDWNDCANAQALVVGRGSCHLPALCSREDNVLPHSLTFLFKKCFKSDRRNVVSYRIDIYKKRRCTNTRDTSGGCKKCVRRCHDGIAGPDSERHQNGQKSIRS